MALNGEFFGSFWDLPKILAESDVGQVLRKNGLGIYLDKDRRDETILSSRCCPYCNDIAFFLDPEILVLSLKSGKFVCKKCKTRGDFIDLLATVLSQPELLDLDHERLKRKDKLVYVTSYLGITPNLPAGYYLDRNRRKYYIERVILGEQNGRAQWHVIYKGASWKNSKVMSLLDFFGYGSVRIKKFVPT